MQTFLAFLAAFIIALISTPVFRKMATSLGIMDFPNQRKIHTDPIPLLGGLGIYLGVLGSFFFNAESLW